MTRSNNQHLNCELEIRNTGNHCGLYCVPHGYWFKWITPAERQQYLRFGVRENLKKKLKSNADITEVYTTTINPHQANTGSPAATLPWE